MGKLIKQIINFTIIPIIAISLFLAYVSYDSNLWSSWIRTSNYIKSGDFEYDYSLMRAAAYDLSNDKTITVKCTDLTVKFYGSDFSNENIANVLECVDTDDRTYYSFRLGPQDHIDVSEDTYQIEYYERSCFIKSITPIYEIKGKSSLNEVNVEITLTEEKTEQNKKAILVNRPEMSDKEIVDHLFWYVTQNGKFYKSFQAKYKTWTNFLSLADKGDYTVTLVKDYDEATGEYTSISNTIEYTIE